MKILEQDSRIILGVAAHPDDLDFGFAGSIALWASQGAKIYYLILTDGSKGTDDRKLSSPELVKKRQNEQRQAAKRLGVAEVFFLSFEDGALECNRQLKHEIVRYIRKLRPHTVLAMDPTMVYSIGTHYGDFINHPDHRAAGQATLDAVYPLARDHLTFPDLLGHGLEPHKVSEVLLVNFDKADYAVDITKYLPQKMDALAAHISQMSDLKHVQQMMTDAARAQGKKHGFTYAEAFVRITVT